MINMENAFLAIKLQVTYLLDGLYITTAKTTIKRTANNTPNVTPTFFFVADSAFLWPASGISVIS